LKRVRRKNNKKTLFEKKTLYFFLPLFSGIPFETFKPSETFKPFEMPFPSKYVESLQRNDKLKKWVMVAMKGGLSGHGIPGGYFSDAFARAAVKKAIKTEREGRKADKEGRKAARIAKIKKIVSAPHRP
jgi:hypothetical protein